MSPLPARNLSLVGQNAKVGPRGVRGPSLLVDGLYVFYQGFCCTPLYEYSRNLGLEPDFGYVHVAREDFKTLTLKSSAPTIDHLRYDSVPRDPGAGEGRTGSVADPASGFVTIGTFSIKEVIDGFEHAVVFRHMLVSEKAIEVAIATDDGVSDMVKIEITDVRYLWQTRGLMFDWINVPRPGSKDYLTKDGKTASRPKSSTSAPPAGTVTLTLGQGLQDASGLVTLQNYSYPNSIFTGTAQLFAWITERAGQSGVDPQALLNYYVALDQRAKMLTTFFAAFYSGKPIPFPPVPGAVHDPRNPDPGIAALGGLTIDEYVGPTPPFPSQLPQAAPQNLRGTLLDRSFTGGSTANFKPDPTTAFGEAPPAQFYIPGSLRSQVVGVALAGSSPPTTVLLPYTLRQALEEKVLPLLHGTPVLRRLPPSLDTPQTIPGAHIWEGVLPIDALRDLMQEFSLKIALNPDCSVSFWLDGEGDLQLDNGQLVPPTDDNLVWTRQLIAWHHMPEVVVVLGPPIVREIDVSGLVAVGLDRTGEIVPLFMACSDAGIAFPEKFALLRPEERVSLSDVRNDGLKAFDEWGFKWYQLPGGADANNFRLPMLNRRAYPAGDGQLLPMRVFASFATVGLTGALNATDPTLPTTTALPAISGPGSFASAGNPFARDAGASVFGVSAPGSFGNAQADPSASGIPIAAVVASANIPDARVPLFLYNAPMCVDGGGKFTVDAERGIVKFHEMVFKVAQAAVKQEAEAVPADVRVIYSIQQHAGTTGKPSLDDHYFSVWLRGPIVPGAGPPLPQQYVAAAPDGSGNAPPSLPAGVVPYRMLRPDLEQYVSITGETNKKRLDSIAQAAVKAFYATPDSTTGGIAQLCRPYALVNTGRVRSLRWTTTRSEGKPFLEAHVDAWQPYTPPPATTYAREPNVLPPAASGHGDNPAIGKGLRKK